jgi:hypothetical protein
MGYVRISQGIQMQGTTTTESADDEAPHSATGLEE